MNGSFEFTHSDSKSLSVFLTGANGFVGNAILHRLLTDGYHVTVGGRRCPSGFRGPFARFDLQASESVARALEHAPHFDVVVNASGSLDTACDAINRGGTVQLLAQLAEKTGRWIQISSAGVYRNNFDGTIDELTSCDPCSPYELSKLEADAVVLASLQNAVILRPTMVVGQGMKGSPLKSLSRVLSWGIAPNVSPDHVLSLVHVEDVADAVSFFCGVQNEHGGGAFILSDDLDMPTVISLLSAPPDSGAKRRHFLVPKTLMDMAAAIGSFAGIPGLNRRRLRQLTNRARFSSSRLRGLFPEWPRVGSRAAVRQFATRAS